MSKKYGKRVLSVQIPTALFHMYSKVCIDAGVTKTEGIVQYFEYLKGLKPQYRRMVDGDSERNFKLDASKRREL